MDNAELLLGLKRHDFLKTITMASASVMAIPPSDILACSPLLTGFLLPESTIDNPYIYRHTLNTREVAWVIGNWSAPNLGYRAMMISSFYESGFDFLLAFRLGFEDCKGKILDTINISEIVWYVDSSAGPGSSVRSFSPLTNDDVQGIDLTNPAEDSNLNVGGKMTINIYADNAIRIYNIGPGGDIDFGEVEIAICEGSKSESFISETRIFAGSFAHRG